MDVAKEIRKYDKYGIIIFITTHSEFAPITYAYKVSAFDFIDKDSSIDDIQEHIFEGLSHLRSMNTTQHGEELFVFRNQNTSFKFLFPIFFILKRRKFLIKSDLFASLDWSISMRP